MRADGARGGLHSGWCRHRHGEEAAHAVHRLRQQGFEITHVRRPMRTGFKAGWLLMGFDLALFATAALFLPMDRVFYSLVGAITMNLFVAWNHRYEWYIAR